MKLYYSRGACSLAVRIVLHELQLKCEYEGVDLKTHKTETGADFYQINPKGAVPVLVLDDKQILTENSVIQQYLAEKQGNTALFPPSSDFKHYRVLEWLNFISTDIHKGYGPLFNPKVPQEIKDTVFIPILKNKLKIMDSHINQNKFIMGDTFTLPDAYMFVMLLWLRNFKIELEVCPNLKRYFAELKTRKSIQDALEEEKIKLLD
jgi:glutathione S-transferase